MPISKSIIEAAIVGFEQQKAQIDDQIAELRAMLSGGPVESTAAGTAAPKTRKKFSAAVRRKMALAQQARWAKIRGTAEPAPAPAKAPKTKRKLSAAGRAAIIAATKKMWARKRAEAAKARKAPAKKAAAKKKAPEAVAQAT